MLATVASATLVGVEGRPVAVEVHVSTGLPSFTIVGLPDAACREARDRVRAALLSSGLRWELRRVTVNLAPSGLRKVGSGLDLPIAVGLLAATGVLDPALVKDVGFVGELGLDGTLRRVPGLLALAAATAGRLVVVPEQGAPEAALGDRERVRAAASLAQVLGALRGEDSWAPVRMGGGAAGGHEATGSGRAPDLSEVRGHRLGRRALEVAAAGQHHLLFVGPPGSGKTMLARRLPGLLPPLGPRLALEVTRVHSAAGLSLPEGALLARPPFRAPHHSASLAALVGGGTAVVRPGEVSLAHHGVLFLDELGEFPAQVLDALRQPLEEGVVRVCRARGMVSFPARFLLVGAMNPCPCGEGGRPGACRCSEAVRARYARRVSGPLLDRFDVRIRLERPSVAALIGGGKGGEPTAVVAARVARARERARARGVGANSELPGDALDELAPLERAARALLERRLREGRLSARGLHRVRRVARTLADLDGAGDRVGDEHVAEALELRLDRSALLGEAA